MSTPSPASYTTRIERGGVEVVVTIDLDSETVYRDSDELNEVAAHAAGVVSTRVHESIARAENAEPF